MPAYTDRWLQLAIDQYFELPDEQRHQVDQRIEELLVAPEGPSRSYDQPSDQWTTTYGDGTGLIVYAVVPEYRRVLILRII